MGLLLLFWAGLGAVVGYLAARHRGFSPAAGVVVGLVLGPLAVVLFFVPVGGYCQIGENSADRPPRYWARVPS